MNNLPTTQQGASIALGANDPRARRNDAAVVSGSEEARRRVQALQEVDETTSDEELRARLNAVIRLLKETL